MTAPQPKDSPLRDGDRVLHETFGAGDIVRAGSFASLMRLGDGTTQIVTNSGLSIVKLRHDNDNNPAEPLTFINPANWHGEPIPARQWYSEGLIPLRQVTILNGDGGVGKSLLALQIAAAGAMSLDTLEMEPWAGRTLYIGAEDEAEEFHRRLADIAKAHGQDLDFLFMFRLLSLADQDALLAVPDRSGNMHPTPLFAKIIEFACEFKPRLIVLDTAADLFGGDEIKRGQVRQFIAMLRKLAISLDCAVILLAHPSIQGMQTGTGSSGSTAWNNSVRSRLYLTRPDGKDSDPDLRILKTMKANYGTTGNEIKLRWKDGAFVLDDGRPAVGSMLVAAKADRVFIETLIKLFQQGQKLSPSPSATYAPKIISNHLDANGLSRKELAAAQQRLLDACRIRIVEEGPPSRRTRHIVAVEEQPSA
ncbi:AAA family ATPase [Rhizobium lusitanum]|uniref:AAA family ATPase n=1 Tax=Rhizobium lusitanum TaxID=293958 RepID=UPI00161B16B2|nr:AAA family ATPase [Rhizobium lusitanum]QND48104.1 AAA family ATPase [Rhizobium lusitanum]